MLTEVTVQPKHLESYRASVNDGVLESIHSDSRPLVGARVLHVNATAYGGGVAEILGSLVPLLRDIGILADWKVIGGTDEFFKVTKSLHNALQGKPHDWNPGAIQTWIEQNRLNAEGWEDYDFVVIHDPQPAPILKLLRSNAVLPSGKWLWRCHIDLTDAQPEAWDLVRPFVSEYDATIWTMRQYVREGIPEDRIFVTPPAIDPLSPKNAPLDEADVAGVLRRFDIDPNRPIICQVSRFDPWKDPLGVIDAYRMVKSRHAGAQLILAGPMAHDDPEGWEWYEKVLRRAGEDYDVKVLTNLNGVGNTEINAFQRAANVIVQKSTREGFGLVVAEGLWKGRPCVGGNVGGIPLQVHDGVTGYLVDSAESCAAKVSALLDDPALARRMGAAGREEVREKFLITRQLHDYVRMFLKLAGTPVAV